MEAEEEDEGGDVADEAVTTMDLTGTTHIMAGINDFATPTSGGISPARNLTRPGAMGACMYSTSAIVTWTPSTPRRPDC